MTTITLELTETEAQAIARSLRRSGNPVSRQVADRVREQLPQALYCPVTYGTEAQTECGDFAELAEGAARQVGLALHLQVVHGMSVTASHVRAAKAISKVFPEPVDAEDESVFEPGVEELLDDVDED